MNIRLGDANEGLHSKVNIKFKSIDRVTQDRRELGRHTGQSFSHT